MAYFLSGVFNTFQNNESIFGPLPRLSRYWLYFLGTYWHSFSALKRRILAAAAAAGISVAFGSPLGGVLFGLEGKILWVILEIGVDNLHTELDTFANETEVMWRGFVTSVIAAVSLQYIDPFRTSKLVLFQVCFIPTFASYFRQFSTQVNGINDTWRAFELVSMSWHHVKDTDWWICGFLRSPGSRWAS